MAVFTSRNEVRFVFCVCAVHDEKAVLSYCSKTLAPQQVIIMLALFISLFSWLTISIKAAAFCP